MYRFLITGSRTWDQPQIIEAALVTAYERYGVLTLMHGGCRGADTIASSIWGQWGLPLEEYPADWETYGKRAGYLRNQQMIDQMPLFALAFPQGDSKGTRMTIKLCQNRNIPVVTIEYPPQKTVNDANQNSPSIQDGLVLP